MKNRRNVIIAFLLCACLIVGVGYASLSTTLALNGSASLTDEYMEELFDSKIYWVSAESEDDTKVSASISADKNTITLNANGLTTVNEEIEVLCKMKNESTDLSVTVTEPALVLTPKATGDEDYFEVRVVPISDKDLAPGESGTVIVYFKLLKSFVPTNEKTLVQADFNLTYTIESVAN